MKLLDIEKAIEGLKKSFGDDVLNNDVFMDFTFDNEIMVELGSECVTTLICIPESSHEEENSK